MCVWLLLRRSMMIYERETWIASNTNPKVIPIFGSDMLDLKEERVRLELERES